ncbi:FMN-dependent NADH-azoreductase [Labedaea rhizosphaerae]|uniref:FMN dependent NADH:quinone oxidoreductase n=1 Tax=Labedaea rhizosphaerae TaxID=598644 RepID=A0A4R6SD69_LABRH|nr:NAD(P)H-dependent oxidoreductase [Labedaea rhizosphaerae]TDP97871.1 FMN-dependent NADH-azoreductase [Labedaea rhizosphaerae]
MTNLLHIDSSLRGAASVSKEVTAIYANAWRAAHPDGGYRYRDLAGNPVPHLDAVAHAAAQVDPAEHTEEQRQAFQHTADLLDELHWADTVLIGAPMYNFTVSSLLKTWMDRLFVPAHFVDPATGRGILSDKKVIIATARGGSYAPGTPREPLDFQEPYLRGVLGQIGLLDITFVHTEMTLADTVPALAQFKDFAAQSRRAAHETVRELARSA